MIEVNKILHGGIYDKDILEGILHLARDSRTRGFSLKLMAQHFKMEIRKIAFQSLLSSRGIRYLNLLSTANV